MKKYRKSSDIDFKKYWSNIILIILIIAEVTFFIIKSRDFLNMQNLSVLFLEMSSIGIICIGQTLLLLSGMFDISVGSLTGFAGIVFAKILIFFNFKNLLGFLVAILVTVIICGIIGYLNGTIISRIGINSLITTLAMLWILLGLSIGLTGGKDVSLSDNPMVVFLGTYKIGGFIPIHIVVLLILFLVFYFILKWTIFGRYIYAIGSNEISAIYTGVNVKNVRILLFTLMGILTGISGILLTSKMFGAHSSYGSGYPLDSIAIVVLGGTLISGGQGGLLGTVIALFLWVILGNGLSLLGITIYVQQVSLGIVLIAILLISSYLERRSISSMNV